MESVYLAYRKEAEYPKTDFNPAISYPEYLFGNDSISSEENDVYDMVRECLIGLGLDQKNYGTPAWNPMGEYVKPGDHVLIKPNWVMHYNGAKNVKENDMECLVTHPSCLRAICDYCLIALQGEGQVTIGDAPMQDCDLPVLLEKMRFNDILDFYTKQGQPVKFADLRKYQSTFNRHSVIVGKIYQDGEGIDVDLGTRSMHEERVGKRVYQVDNYSRYETESYHCKDRHIYSINKTVLDADVIINFCKPKSHRLAGFTAAMKNMVGIAYNKASLPHRVEGSTAEGGDAYLNESALKKKIDQTLDKKIRHEESGKFLLATIDRYIYCALLVLARKIGKDPYIKGIWYGNDTIWRTVVDLNYIVTYADKQGKLQIAPQRRMINFADMIIGGDHNGPCQPEPKEMGVLLASESASAMDRTICRIIGFNEEKIPMAKAMTEGKADYLLGHAGREDIMVLEADNRFTRLSDMEFDYDWTYRPHDMWGRYL